MIDKRLRNPPFRWIQCANFDVNPITSHGRLLTLSLMMRSMMHSMSEVLMSMKDASIYMMRRANMITPNGGKAKKQR